MLKGDRKTTRMCQTQQPECDVRTSQAPSVGDCSPKNSAQVSRMMSKAGEEEGEGDEEKEEEEEDRGTQAEWEEK